MVTSNNLKQAILNDDELEDYQNRLDSCICFDELYNLCDEILWNLKNK